MCINHRTVVWFAVLALLAGCGHKTSSSLSGTYVLPIPGGQASADMEFHPDGTGLMQIQKGGVSGTVKFTYTITGNTLEISDPSEVDKSDHIMKLKIDDNACLYDDTKGADTNQKICKSK